MAKSKNKNIPDFIPLYGWDNKLNSRLISEVLESNGRYYVKDIYDIVFRIDEKTYNMLREEL